MTEAGRRLLQAANEALAIAEGKADPRTYVVHAPPETVDVKAIRKSMNMTQVVFGERFGFGAARVRDWEQKRTRPAASDRVLLTTIKFAPDVVLTALASSEAATRAMAKSPQREREPAKTRKSTKPAAAAAE